MSTTLAVPALGAPYIAFTRDPECPVSWANLGHYQAWCGSGDPFDSDLIQHGLVAIVVLNLSLKRLAGGLTSQLLSANKIKKGVKAMTGFLVMGLCVVAGGFLTQTMLGGDRV